MSVRNFLLKNGKNNQQTIFIVIFISPIGKENNKQEKLKKQVILQNRMHILYVVPINLHTSTYPNIINS